MHGAIYYDIKNVRYMRAQSWSLNLKKAYPYIDFLKMLGLLCIMLAHVNPPQIIMQLRNFDVPFMVILSGMLAANSIHTPPHIMNI